MGGCVDVCVCVFGNVQGVENCFGVSTLFHKVRIKARMMLKINGKLYFKRLRLNTHGVKFIDCKRLFMCCNNPGLYGRKIIS